MDKLVKLINKRPKHQRRKLIDALVKTYFKQEFGRVPFPQNKDFPYILEFESSKEFFQFISDLLKLTI